MPDFLLPSEGGGLTGRAKVLERGPAIISFDRGHWCSFCRLELFSLARLYPEVERLGGSIVSIEPERQKFALVLKSRCALPFPLFLDIDNSLGLALGLVISVGEELRNLYQARNFDLQDFHGVASWLLPVPASYVIDQAGIIRAKFADPDFRRRMEPDDMLAAMETVCAD